MIKPKIFTGIRPTGELHLGHYFSLIKPIMEYVNDYDIIIMIADLHAHTELRRDEVDYDELLNQLSMNTMSCIHSINNFVPIDNLTIFLQSNLRFYHYDLFYKLLMISRHNQTFGNPVFQEAMRNEYYHSIDLMKLDKEIKYLLKIFIEDNLEILWGNISPKIAKRLQKFLIKSGIRTNKELLDKIIKMLNTRIGVMGLASYPVLMAADIILYDPQYVLVGKDQSPHLQITNEFVRLLNQTFNKEINYIEPMIIDDKTIKGNDGMKMSKTLDNHLPLRYLLNNSLNKSLDWFMRMKTFPRRKTDPGDPTNCLVADYYNLFDLNCVHFAQCCVGEIGCVECKSMLHDQIKTLIIQSALEEPPKINMIEDVLDRGLDRAKKIMMLNKEVTSLLGINYEMTYM